jgi:hypothetical protein
MVVANTSGELKTKLVANEKIVAEISHDRVFFIFLGMRV